MDNLIKKLQDIHRDTKKRSIYLWIDNGDDEDDYNDAFKIFTSKSQLDSFPFDDWLDALSEYRSPKILNERALKFSISLKNSLSDAKLHLQLNSDFFNTEFFLNIETIKNKFRKDRVVEASWVFAKNSRAEPDAKENYDELDPFEDIEHIIDHFSFIQRIHPNKVRDIFALKGKACIYLAVFVKMRHRQIAEILDLPMCKIKHFLAQFRARIRNQRHDQQVPMRTTTKERRQAAILWIVQRMLANKEQITIGVVQKRMVRDYPSLACSYSTVQRAFKDKMGGKFVPGRKIHHEKNSPSTKVYRRYLTVMLADFLASDYLVISIDETSFSSTNHKCFNWMFPKLEAASVRFKDNLFTNITLLLAISQNSTIAYMLIDGSVNQIIFAHFIEEIVNIPFVRNYHDNKKLIFLMDNLICHQTPLIKVFQMEYELTILFNARYSPELNYVENAFNIIKQRFESYGPKKGK